MAEAHRFEQGEHYGTVCPPSAAIHRSGTYRALTTREKEVYQERIATLKHKWMDYALSLHVLPLFPLV